MPSFSAVQAAQNRDAVLRALESLGGTATTEQIAAAVGRTPRSVIQTLRARHELRTWFSPPRTPGDTWVRKWSFINSTMEYQDLKHVLLNNTPETFGLKPARSRSAAPTDL